MSNDVPAGAANMAAFFAALRPMFGGHLTQQQVDGINDLLEAWRQWGDGDNRKLAYVLATAYHETGRTMQPVKEAGSAAYLRAKKYWPYIGRGHVQLTWDYNYQKVGKIVGVDLVGKPDLALEPQLSARICVQGMMQGWFTGKTLADYIGDAPDFDNARRIVNGMDKAMTIAGYAVTFLKAMKATSGPAEPPQPADDGQDRPPRPPPSLASLILRAVTALVTAILSALGGSKHR